MLCLYFISIHTLDIWTKLTEPNWYYLINKTFTSNCTWTLTNTKLLRALDNVLGLTAFWSVLTYNCLPQMMKFTVTQLLGMKGQRFRWEGQLFGPSGRGITKHIILFPVLSLSLSLSHTHTHTQTHTHTLLLQVITPSLFIWLNTFCQKATISISSSLSMSLSTCSFYLFKKFKANWIVGPASYCIHCCLSCFINNFATRRQYCFVLLGSSKNAIYSLKSQAFS